MELLKQYPIKNTDLCILERVRPVNREEYDLKENKRLIPLDYKSKLETAGYVSARVTLTKEFGKVLLDLLHPQEEGRGFGLPNGDTLFDTYCRDREDVVDSPKHFIAEHKESSTINLKRSVETKKAEADRVNVLIESNIDDLKDKVHKYGVELLTLAIDTEVGKHNSRVKETLNRWVLENGINEDWVLEHLYTDEAKESHHTDEADMKSLSDHIDKLRDSYRQVKKQRNSRRRAIVHQHLTVWCEGIPEVEECLKEMDVAGAVENDINLMIL